MARRLREQMHDLLTVWINEFEFPVQGYRFGIVPMGVPDEVIYPFSQLPILSYVAGTSDRTLCW